MKNPHEFDLKKSKKFSIFTFGVYLTRKEMCGKIFLCFFSPLIINCYFSMCTGYWITDLKFETLSNTTNEISRKDNEVESFQQVNENKSTSTTENDGLFWTLSDLNGTSETNLELQTVTQEVEPIKSEDDFENLDENTNGTASTSISPSENAEVDETTENQSQTLLSDNTEAPNFTMDEKIVLQRNNCHLEIAIQESHDLKIEIRFEKLENNTSGHCCITLNGQENNMLGVLISNVHLYGNGSQGEVLKVITADYGLNFVLKEYYSKNNYEPLLLTETHKVYVVLYYKVTDASLCKQDTYFNLEVYSYKKYENHIHYGGNSSQFYF